MSNNKQNVGKMIVEAADKAVTDIKDKNITSFVLIVKGEGITVFTMYASHHDVEVMMMDAMFKHPELSDAVMSGCLKAGVAHALK